jgi:hypothetical protein
MTTNGRDIRDSGNGVLRSADPQEERLHRLVQDMVGNNRCEESDAAVGIAPRPSRRTLMSGLSKRRWPGGQSDLGRT